MKRLTFLLSAGLLMSLAGCAGQKQEIETGPSLNKPFFSRTISYSLEPKAREQLKKLEVLIEEAHGVERPIPDRILITYYRDADSDRDHFITDQESDRFFSEFIIQFEDNLGATQYN